MGTVLGLLWLLIQPALLVAFYTFIFSVVFKVRTGGDVRAMAGDNAGHASYAVFVLGGLVPWLAFADGVNRAAGSIVSNKAIITNVVFPIELLPMSVVAAAQVGFLAMSGMLLILVAFGGDLSFGILWLPLLQAILILLSLGLGYALAVVSTFFRDVTNLMPFAMTLWLYASPVLYARSALPEQLRPLLSLNPVAPVIEAYRSTLVYGTAPEFGPLAYSAVAALVVFIVGFGLFQRAQRLFVEVI